MLKSSKLYLSDYRNIILFSSILFSLLYHIFWWHFPLVRDEGEFATIAKQILEDIPLYDQSYNYKLPGVSVLFTSMMLLFGKTFWSVRFIGMLINLLSLWMIYQLSLKLFNKKTASFSTLFYSILSNHYAMIAYSSMSEQFVVFFILTGLVFLLKHRNILYSGIFFGLAFTMKQSAIPMLFIPYIYILGKDFSISTKAIKRILLQFSKLSIGIFLPYILIVIWVIYQGNFEAFWNWTFVYPTEYSQILPVKYGLISLFRNLLYIIYSYYVLWIMAAIGLFILIISSSKSKRTFFLAWSFLAFLSLSSGMYYRFHYFYFILPIIAISIAYFLNWLLTSPKIERLIAKSFLRREKTIILIGLFIILLTAIKVDIYPTTKYNQRELVRRYEGLNPYYEMPIIAQKLNNYLENKDKVVVFGSEAEFYFYSKNLNATSYLFTYELVKPHHGNLQMQKEMIAQITKNKPKIFIDVEVYTSWLRWNNTPDKLFRWKDQYLKQYRRIGLVEYDMKSSEFWWDIPDDFETSKKNVITIYEKK